VPVDLVITSEFRRTRETAGPLVRDRDLEPVVIGAGNGLRSHLEGIVEAVQGKPGGSILVVGHANTVPRIIEALGGPALADLSEDTYDALFTLVLEPGRTPRLVRSRYGAGSGD
jgi:phosphohistidine phosphatase SixA